MQQANGKTFNIDSDTLKRLARICDSGISIRSISEQMHIDEKTVKRLLRLLGYASAQKAI